jgi:multiple sugar transport system permease protein
LTFRTERGGYLFVIPSLVVLTLVTVFPLVYVFWLSLNKMVLILDTSVFVGLDNYVFLLSDERFVTSFINTVYFTVTSVLLELALGMGVALLLNRAIKGRGILRAVVLVPWAIPTVVTAKMWKWLYNADFGLLNYLLGVKIDWLGSPMWAMNAAVFMDVWKTTPFVALLLTAGLQVIPRELYHAAKVDGAGPFFMFRKVTLRTIDAFRVFDAIYVLTGGGPANSTETLSIYAYKVLFQIGRFGYGSALSMIVFLCVGGISIFYVRLLWRR